MTEFIALALLFWIPAFIVFMRNVFWDLYLWQIKEFRWDRFWVYIRWDQEETNRATGAIAIKFILFTMVSLLFAYPLIAMLGVILSISVWFNQAVQFGYKLYQNTIRRPSVKNARNILILLILLFAYIGIASLITIPFAVIERDDSVEYQTLVADITPAETELGEFVYPDVYLFLGLATLVALLIDLITPFLVALTVGITHPLARIRRKLIITKAQRHIKHKDLVIIGITGSEGKTTTKEIIYELLSENYNVAKTPKNYNSDVGVARGILEEVKKDTQIFVAEMGAYRAGEIRSATKAFPPEISVVTTLDRQHIGIFGGKQKLFEAKSEIVQGLQKDGTAILNADNHMVRDMDALHSGRSVFVTTKKDIFTQTNKKHNPELISMLVENMSANHNSLRFSIKTHDQSETFTVPFAGEHLYMNIALAIGVAMELNVPLKTIKKLLQNYDKPLPRQEILNGDDNTTIINDSYNSSFNGFVAAVQTMNKRYKKNKNGKRIIISKGIYELGAYKKTTYIELFEKINKQYDVLITSDALLYQVAQQNNTHAQHFLYQKPEEMLYEMRKQMDEHDIILLEGRLHPMIIKELISDET